MSCWRHQYATEISVYNYLLVPTVETVSCCCAAVEEDDFSCTPIDTDDFSCTPIDTDDFCCTPIDTDDFCCTPIDTDDFCCTPIATDDFSCTPIETDDFCCAADDCFSSSVGSSGLEVTMSFSELDIMVVEAPGELPMGGQYSKLMSVLVRRKRGKGR